MVDYTKWSILPPKTVTRKDSLYRLRAHKIVYLDDHDIYTTAIKKYCIRPFFPNAVITEFKNGDEAFIYVANQLEKKIPIDLIITDIIHPGLNGDYFIELVRHLEKLQRRGSRIPLIVISMVDDISMIQKLAGPDKILVNNYLTKTAAVDLIVHCLEEILL